MQRGVREEMSYIDEEKERVKLYNLTPGLRNSFTKRGEGRDIAEKKE